MKTDGFRGGCVSLGGGEGRARLGGLNKNGWFNRLEFVRSGFNLFELDLQKAIAITTSSGRGSRRSICMGARGEEEDWAA